MALRTEDFAYDAGGVAMAGHLAWDDAIAEPLPGIAILPSVRGPTSFEEEKAAALATLGYAALVVDFYGVEARSAPGADIYALMGVLNDDRRLLHVRLEAGLDVLKARPQVDGDRVAAIGYCFGGKCVLDMARIRADLAGVAAFHGLFDAPPFETLPQIAAKIVAFHGWEDPLAPPAAVMALATEMTTKGADWQLHAYGHTSHGFTNPQAHEHAKGIYFKPDADRRSWAALLGFLSELFG